MLETYEEVSKINLIEMTRAVPRRTQKFFMLAEVLEPSIQHLEWLYVLPRIHYEQWVQKFDIGNKDFFFFVIIINHLVVIMNNILQSCQINYQIQGLGPMIQALHAQISWFPHKICRFHWAPFLLYKLGVGRLNCTFSSVVHFLTRHVNFVTSQIVWAHVVPVFFWVTPNSSHMSSTSKFSLTNVMITSLTRWCLFLFTSNSLWCHFNCRKVKKSIFFLLSCFPFKHMPHHLCHINILQKCKHENHKLKKINKQKIGLLINNNNINKYYYHHV